MRIRSVTWLFAPMLLAACGSGASTPSPVSYAGEWVGTTSFAGPMAFTVSSGMKVTRISIAYNFNGCSGTLAFTPDVAIDQVPTAPVPVGSAVFDSGRDAPGGRTMINFLFTAPADAHGLAIFSDFPGCGTGPTPLAWTATRR
jgi:hypothetical protein